jgi:hypothetical protein
VVDGHTRPFGQVFLRPLGVRGFAARPHLLHFSDRRFKFTAGHFFEELRSLIVKRDFVLGEELAEFSDFLGCEMVQQSLDAPGERGR